MEMLQAYAPTFTTLIDPPKEFRPEESNSKTEPLLVNALQLEQAALTTFTLMPLAVVIPQVLRLTKESL